MALKKSQKSLKNWTKQKWRTKSGKPSAKTGERYLPSAAIKSLTSSEYAATTRAKRKGKAAGKQSLKNWTKQKWRTKSGKPSAKTGERYLPEKAIKALTAAEYAATSRAKRKGTKKGKQFVKQPKRIAKKTRRYR